MPKMKTSTALRITICTFLAVSFVTPCFAKGRKKATPAPTPHAIVISSITTNSVTVTDEKTTKTVTVTPFTEVTINGQKANFTDLKPGMTVQLGLSGPTQASRITATSK